VRALTVPSPSLSLDASKREPALLALYKPFLALSNSETFPLTCGLDLNGGQRRCGPNAKEKGRLSAGLCRYCCCCRCCEKRRGARRWASASGDAVLSQPASFYGGLVLVGLSVRALDMIPKTGGPDWTGVGVRRKDAEAPKRTIDGVPIDKGAWGKKPLRIHCDGPVCVGGLSRVPIITLCGPIVTSLSFFLQHAGGIDQWRLRFAALVDTGRADRYGYGNDCARQCRMPPSIVATRIGDGVNAPCGWSLWRNLFPRAWQGGMSCPHEESLCQHVPALTDGNNGDNKSGSINVWVLAFAMQRHMPLLHEGNPMVYTCKDRTDAGERERGEPQINHGCGKREGDTEPWPCSRPAMDGCPCGSGRRASLLLRCELRGPDPGSCGPVPQTG